MPAALLPVLRVTLVAAVVEQVHRVDPALTLEVRRILMAAADWPVLYPDLANSMLAAVVALGLLIQLLAKAAQAAVAEVVVQTVKEGLMAQQILEVVAVVAMHQTAATAAAVLLSLDIKFNRKENATI